MIKTFSEMGFLYKIQNSFTDKIKNKKNRKIDWKELFFNWHMKTFFFL